MRLNDLFEADDPFAKYWNPAEKEVEKQKAFDKRLRGAQAMAYGGMKHMQSKASDAEYAMTARGEMDPDKSRLTHTEKEPFETRQVRFKNSLYTVRAYSAGTPDGPETRVEFYGPDGQICDVQQEPSDVDGIIEMWMEVGDHGPIRRRDETKF